MKPLRAIFVLALPLASTWLVLLAGLCLTPYWTCKVDWSVPLSAAWKPFAFVIVVLFVAAAVVLAVDLVLVRVIPPARYRWLFLAVAGAVIATLPKALWDLREVSLIEAFRPQVEFLPFSLAGAVFILLLARLVDQPRIESSNNLS